MTVDFLLPDGPTSATFSPGSITRVHVTQDTACLIKEKEHSGIRCGLFETEARLSLNILTLTRQLGISTISSHVRKGGKYFRTARPKSQIFCEDPDEITLDQGEVTDRKNTLFHTVDATGYRITEST